MIIRIIVIFFLAFFILSATSLNLHAASNTPTPESELEKQIDSLTSKIASRVAELKLVEKRGVIGIVTDASNTQITINDIQGNTIFIDVDEFTDFTPSSSKSSFGISDIKKGDKLGILGLYNKESRRILARFVNVLNLPQVIRGVVVSVDSDEFTISIKSSENKDYSTDVESSTRTVSYDQDKKILVRSGFSKIEENQTIIIIGYPDLKDPKIFEASRIILLPDLPVNPKIKISAPTSSPTPSKSN